MFANFDELNYLPPSGLHGKVKGLFATRGQNRHLKLASGEECLVVDSVLITRRTARSQHAWRLEGHLARSLTETAPELSHCSMGRERIYLDRFWNEF